VSGARVRLFEDQREDWLERRVNGELERIERTGGIVFQVQHQVAPWGDEGVVYTVLIVYRPGREEEA